MLYEPGTLVSPLSDIWYMNNEVSVEFKLNKRISRVISDIKKGKGNIIL